MMEVTNLDKRIEFAERKVLVYQARIIEQKEKANQTVKRLERDAKGQDEIKKEWIRKRNLEEERIRLATLELRKAHRHVIEDMRLKYEQERENKLRELKLLIHEVEAEMKGWQRKRSEAVMKTKSEEAQIKSRFQAKINALLRDEESASRRGVVRQKRLLDTPNVFSMSLERHQPLGMKRRAYPRKRGG